MKAMIGREYGGGSSGWRGRAPSGRAPSMELVYMYPYALTVAGVVPACPRDRVPSPDSVPAFR